MAGTIEISTLNLTSPNGLVTKPITLDNNGVPFFNGIQIANTASPSFTGTPSAPTAASGTKTTQIATTAYSNSLLAEYTVTGSAVTSIDFSGLDINTHKSYRIEIEFSNATSSQSLVNCYVNNDTVETNYYSEYFQAAGASVSCASVNSPWATVMRASMPSEFVLLVSRNSTGHVFMRSVSALMGGDSDIQCFDCMIHKTATVTNITRLTFIAAVASSIAVGSTIRIYRGDV